MMSLPFEGEVEDLPLIKVSETQSQILSQPITAEEIHEALRDPQVRMAFLFDSIKRIGI